MERSPPTSTPIQTASARRELGLAGNRLPGARREPVAGAFDPLVRVEAAEGELGDGAPLRGERLDRDPARRVHRLHLLGVVHVAVLGQRPLEQPEVGAARVGERALPPYLRKRERPCTEASERAVCALAGGRDDYEAGVGPLQGRRAEREVDLVVTVGVQLVDDRERGREPVQFRRVGGENPQVAAEPLRLVRVLAPAQLEVADDDVLVLKPQGEGGGRLVEDPRLLARGSGAVDGRMLDRDEVMQRDGGEQGRLC